MSSQAFKKRKLRKRARREERKRAKVMRQFVEEAQAGVGSELSETTARGIVYGRLFQDSIFQDVPLQRFARRNAQYQYPGGKTIKSTISFRKR